MPNPLENGNYNPNLVWINKISKIFVRIMSLYFVSLLADIRKIHKKNTHPKGGGGGWLELLSCSGVAAGASQQHGESSYDPL